MGDESHPKPTPSPSRLPRLPRFPFLPSRLPSPLSQVRASLSKAGLPATDANVRAMMDFVNADEGEGQAVTYGHFRNFLLLLPPERLEGDAR